MSILASTSARTDGTAATANVNTSDLGALVLRHPDHVILRGPGDLARAQASHPGYEPTGTAAPIQFLLHSPAAFTYVLQRVWGGGIGDFALLPNRVICRERDLPAIHAEGQATYVRLATEGEWGAYELVGARSVEAFAQQVSAQRGSPSERAARVRDELIRQQAHLPAWWDGRAILAATDYLREHPGSCLASAMREGAKVAMPGER